MLLLLYPFDTQTDLTDKIKVFKLNLIKFLYIYLVIHLLCFGMVLAMHGAFLNPYWSQIN